MSGLASQIRFPRLGQARGASPGSLDQRSEEWPLFEIFVTDMEADSHSEPSCLTAADSSVVLSQDIVETDHMHNILTES